MNVSNRVTAIMRSHFIVFVALSFSTSAWSAVTELKPFEFQSEAKQPAISAGKPACRFPELKLPSDFSILAAGAYSGRKISFQIDQSGHEGTQIDVAVNSPNKPVVLMLGAYEPTIWNIGWSKETKILAVLVSGYHRQAVAGLEKNVPQLNSSYDNRGPCGFFYVTKDSLSALNPIARRVFGQPVEMVFLAEKGKVVVGESIQNDTKLITSPETTPISFYDKDAPMAGPAGLENGVRKGLLRKATDADADAWADAVMQISPQRDIPPVSGSGIPKPPRPIMHNAYVVLKPFTYPAGLYGGHSATFIIPKGIPRPSGNPGHSAVYDLNTLSCQGPLCRADRSTGLTTRVPRSNVVRDENIVSSSPAPESPAQCAGNLRYANEACRKNKALVIEAVRKDGNLLQYADESLKRDKDVVLSAVQQYGFALKYADATLRNDKTIALEAVNSSGLALEFVSAALKSDKDIVRAAVHQNGRALEDALLRDRDIVLAAVKQIGSALKFAPAAMQDDEEVVEAAVTSEPSHGFQYASPRLKSKAEFILKLLNKNKANCCDATLEYVDESLKNDKTFMLKALAINPGFLSFAGEAIKKDKEIGLYAIEHDPSHNRAFAQLDSSLKDDIDVARTAIKRYGGSYNHVSGRLQKNRDLALAAVNWGADMWKYVAQSLKDDLGFVRAAATLNPKVTEYLDIKGRFRKDKDIVLAAIEKSEAALPLMLEESLQRDENFIRAAVKKNGGALRYAPAKFVKDKEIVLVAVQNSGLALAFSGQAHLQDRDIVLAAVKQDWRALAYADKPLRNDPEIVRTAARQNAKALIYTDQTVAKQIGRELGAQIAPEPLIGEISPINEHSRVESSVMTSDGKRIYALKSGTLSQYQIDPFRLISSFKVGFDAGQPAERVDWYQIFITADESKIVIHDTKSIKLLDLTSKRVTQSVTHDSQNGLLVDSVFVTFGPDNVLTLWNAEDLLKIKTIAPDYRWTGTKEARHDEGSTVTRKFSLSRGTSNVFRLGDMVVIAIPAISANHGTSTPGDVFLINKDTFKLVTNIEHYDDNPTLTFDHKSIFVRGLKWVGPRKENANVELGGFWALHTYDLESGNAIVVKPEESPKGIATRLPFRGLSPQVPPPGQFHLLHGQLLVSPESKDASKRLYIYENGEAVLFRYKKKTFELTDNARKYLRVKVSKDEIIPIDDATFDKFVILSGSERPN